ncbi:hypothetical protein [Mailhella massiliensis]|uniref:hypothetical protein n=1 Tax=Mailhella massiliensis TaxID=1903261 RepID=UPI0023F47053|nr:hypothetical protein [Mailhella massiliensis]
MHFFLPVRKKGGKVQGKRLRRKPVPAAGAWREKRRMQGDAASVQGKNRIFFLRRERCGRKKNSRHDGVVPRVLPLFFITSFLLMFFYISRSGKRRFRFAGTGIPDLFFPFPVRVFHALFMHEK